MIEIWSGSKEAKAERLAFFSFVDVYTENHPEQFQALKAQAYDELCELFEGCAWLIGDDELWQRAEDWAFDRLLDELSILWHSNYSRSLHDYAWQLWLQIAKFPKPPGVSRLDCK